MFVNFLQGFDGYIQRGELLTHITVYVKVFHGDRKTFTIKVAILDKIKVIIDEISKKEP